MSIPTNYMQAVTFLNNRTSKMVPGKRGTKVVRETEETVALYYHRTPVVTWYMDGRIIIRSGGYKSVTTKRRINDAVPDIRVWQRNFEWWVTWLGSMSNPEPFHDGMAV